MNNSIERKITRRKATAKERRELGLPKGGMIEDIDLHDPNLAPEHRAAFIAGIRAKVAELDERIGRWYRHRGECGIDGCDCGLGALAEQAEMLCGHLFAAKQLFGVFLVDEHPQFVRFVKDFSENAYATLSATNRIS
jgi:hypothetical protein